METIQKIIFYIIIIVIIIIFIVLGLSNNKTIYSKYIGNIGSNEIDKKQNDTLFNNIFKANMGSNITSINKKKEALINKSFCNFDKNNDSFNNDCIEIKKLIKDSNDINISNDPDHEILLKIYNSNKAIAEQTNQNFDDISGCSMLINHILASQDKSAWDDISKVLKKIKNQYEGLNIFLTCQILKLTTFYSNVGGKEALDWNPFNWGNIKVLNWYKCCKGTTIVNSKIIFYVISLISSIYIYGHWYLWLFKYRNDNKILKFDDIDNNLIHKLFTLIVIILIIISLIYIPSSITNSIDNKVIIPTTIISIIFGIIISSILLDFFKITKERKPKIILGIYVLISFSLFLWYTIDSQKNFNEDNCNKCDDEKVVNDLDDKPLCVSKLNNKDYGGLTINNENGDIYINNKKIKNYSNNQVNKLWILILTSILISIIFGIIYNFTEKPIILIFSRISKIILAILFESINLFALFFYPIFIIVIMVFQRLISSKLFKDDTWYPPFMILIKLYEDSIKK